MATDSQNTVVQGVGLPPDIVDDILAAPHRCHMLQCLAAADDGLVMDELVTCVREETGADATPRDELRANLYDEHLPKLTATGVVTYDSMRECVELAAPAIVEHIE
jgi:hypothetical protein